MRSRQLETALTELIEAAAGHLSAEVAAGAEVPFEVGSRLGRRGRASPPLYCYHALTGTFIAERQEALAALPAYVEAAKLLASFDGLERYLTDRGSDPGHPERRVGATIRALLEEVFEDQTDFDLSRERVAAALQRLESSDLASTSEATLVATLHGLTIASAELQLTKGLTIAQPDALRGVPEAAVLAGEDAPGVLPC